MPELIVMRKPDSQVGSGLEEYISHGHMVSHGIYRTCNPPTVCTQIVYICIQLQLADLWKVNILLRLSVTKTAIKMTICVWSYFLLIVNSFLKTGHLRTSFQVI